ncbi:hypothetical protein [Enterovibrio calviensis]|uniref:hypothetical protein n=1 Tax=Enterovibrio calviensis TaxID=91359 RepID=UPI0037360880
MSDLVIDSDVSEKQYKVTLPCNPEDFTDFVSSLLGKGLTIEKNYSDKYEVDAISLQQLYFLICQRAEQNAGKLVSFNSKLYFSDKSSISFNSPDDLFSHNEIKKVETRSLSIEMCFLIHFPSRQAPEKQTISITFTPGRVLRHRGEFLHVDESEVSLQIHHTEKSWALDIQNLFNEFFSNHIYKPNQLTKIWNKLNSYVSGTAGFLCFGIGLSGIILSYNSIADNIEKEAEKALQAPQSTIEFLVAQSYSTTNVTFFVASIFYVAILIILSIYLADKLETNSRIESRSHLVFTEHDRSLSSKKAKIKKSEFWGLSMDLFKGIIVGVMANIVFTMIWN